MSFNRIRFGNAVLPLELSQKTFDDGFVFSDVRTLMFESTGVSSAIAALIRMGLLSERRDEAIGMALYIKSQKRAIDWHPFLRLG